MGAEAILKLLEKINLEELRVELEKELDDVIHLKRERKLLRD